MDSAIYTAASGMIARQRDLDVIANNLANAGVTAYRPDGTFYEVWRRTETMGGAAGDREAATNAAVQVPAVYTSNQPGPLIPTGAPLDLAIEGDAWLVVQGTGGQGSAGERYTRAGALRLAQGGKLVTMNGLPVLGANGPISLPSGRIEISGDGRIDVDGVPAGTLRLVRPADGDLFKEGANLYRLRPGAAAPPAPPDTAFVRQGNLEGPAVNPTEQLIRLVAAQRAFEQHAKTVGLLMNEVDRRAATDLVQL